ncbi:MAG: FAD:protein FMN transferase [Tissierellia bacterium]|nr:FAD:protein FMN transferase [Tissierellia bacterium]
MKNRIRILLILCLSLLLGCSSKMERHTSYFMGPFDTKIDIIVYTKNQNDAEKYHNYINDRFEELHKLYDKYNSYDGINNIKTINENAGINPITVHKDLYNLIDDSIKWHEEYSDETDISMGRLFNIWSKYRDLNSDEDADQISVEKRLPSEEELKEAKNYSGLEHIILNKEDMTVFIDDKNVQIDVGATAKGYAVELVAQELKDLGLESGMINVGGNVRAIGIVPEKNRDSWYFGIIKPYDLQYMIDISNSNDVEKVLKQIDKEDEYLAYLHMNDISLVTSGDYQRYFVVEDKLYHHLIDKDTYKPGDYFRSVSVITQDSGLADFLSTSLFLMPFEDGKKLVDKTDGVEAIWYMKDGSINYSNDIDKYLEKK